MKLDNSRRETRSENRLENKSAKPDVKICLHEAEVSFLIGKTAMCNVAFNK